MSGSIHDGLRDEFEKRGPWHTIFRVNGVEYGGDEEQYRTDDDPRPDIFIRRFPFYDRVAELSCFEGNHTIKLSRGCGKLVVFEGRQENIDQAKWVTCDVLGRKNVEFILADLDSIGLQDHGAFGAVYCSGLLYHLADPIRLVEQISLVTSRVFVWTHYAKPNQCNDRYRGLSVMSGTEGPGKLSALAGTKSVRMQLHDLLFAFRACGFNHQTVHQQDNNDSRPSVLFSAEKSSLD